MPILPYATNMQQYNNQMPSSTVPSPQTGFNFQDDYTKRLQDAAFKATNNVPNAMPYTQQFKPNQQFDVQNAALHGQLIAPYQDTSQGINDRMVQTMRMGQIATDRANTDMYGRQKQYNDQMNQWDQWNQQQNAYNQPDLNDDVMGNAQKIYNAGKAMGIDDNGIRIGLMTALDESGLKNVNYGDQDSLGLFQQRPSQGWGTQQQVMDPNYAASKFFSNYHGMGNMTPWQVAQSIQRSAYADGSNYQKYWGQANDIFNQLSQGGNGGSQIRTQSVQSNPDLSNWINTFNNRYLDYDHAYGAQCVDLYAYYTSGFVGGRPNPVGYAPEIYNNFDQRAYHQVGNNNVSHMGDVAVWGQGPYTPMGHVAIVVGDNGNGTLRVLQSNARGYAADDPRNTSIISNISKAALMGYLRPNKLGA